MIKNIIIFLVLNFGALAIGAQFTGAGVSSEWYQLMNKAPWTPPGWVFGTSWTTIMICFSIYMARFVSVLKNRKSLIGLFAFQWVFNVIWNPIFFKFHEVGLALIVICALTVLVGVYQFVFIRPMKRWSLLMAPYFLWIIIATSLNWYALAYN
jgi:benzodiazapine receptor